MMSNKIVIVQPPSDSPELTEKFQSEAEAYVKDLGYELLDFNAEDIFKIMAKGGPDCDFHTGPFVIGATSILMAMAGNVCFGRGYETSLYCRELFRIAFDYGLNIINMDIVESG